MRGLQHGASLVMYRYKQVQIWASRRCFTSTPRRLRNRFSVQDELILIPELRTSRFAFTEKSRESLNRKDEVLLEKYLTALGFDSQKRLEREYDKANTVIFESLQGLARVGEAEVAKAIRIFATTGELGKVRYFLSELRRSQAAQTPEVFFLEMLRGAAANCSAEELLCLFEDEILRFVKSPSEALHIEFIKGIMRLDQKLLMEAVQSFCSAFPSPNDVSRITLIEAFGKLKQYEKALKISELLPSNRWTLSLLLMSACDAESFKDADIVLRKAASGKHGITQKALEKYVILAIANNRAEEAAHMIYSGSMLRLTDPAYQRMLAEALASSGQEGLGWAALPRQELTKQDRELTVISMARGLASANQLESAVSLVRRTKADSASSWEAIEEGLRKAGQVDKARRLKDAIRRRF